MTIFKVNVFILILKISLPFLKNIFIFICVCVCMPQHTGGSQRAMYRIWFSHCTNQCRTQHELNANKYLKPTEPSPLVLSYTYVNICNEGAKTKIRKTAGILKPRQQHQTILITILITVLLTCSLGLLDGPASKDVCHYLTTWV